MDKYKLTMFVACFLLSSTLAFAEKASTVSYDISGGSGTRDGVSYSEIHLGLNWFIQDYLNWRNSLFTQFGDKINTVYGLDSAALFNTEFYNSNRNLGLELYAGPGVRMASENSNAVFGKAGLVFALGGIRLGGGVQALHYFETRRETNGTAMPLDEVQTFITISGGGTL
jgi:hypothetical protein